MLRILILDDMKVRHEAFKRIYEGHDVVSVYGYHDFVSKLAEAWDIIHLDHDLGDEMNADTYVDGWGKVQEYNGMNAAYHLICIYMAKAKPNVIIHSINSVGAVSMKKMLLNAGFDVKWEPFGDVS